MIGQVDRIRELSARKKAGEISDQEFAEQKSQLLEMETLRREAEEEAMRREQVCVTRRPITCTYQMLLYWCRHVSELFDVVSVVCSLASF